MSIKDEKIMDSIGSTEESTFNELCNALGDDCPEGGDKGGWAELFGILRTLESKGLITVTRTGGKIDGVQLTQAGADTVRARLDSRRGLLGGVE